MASIEERVAGLSPAKRALLQSKLLERAAAQTPIQPRHESGPWSLADPQVQVWLREQLHPRTAVNNMMSARRLIGPLDTECLREAYTIILQRHEPLRTTFHIVDGQPLQVVHDAHQLNIELIDLSGVSETEQLQMVDDTISAQLFRPFNLEADCMLRVTLVRLAPENHVLIQTGHHLATDGWSAGIIARELSTVYTSLRSGGGSGNILRPLGISYADFAAWQRDWLKTGPETMQLEFWKNQLRDAPQVLTLPVDRPRSASGSIRGASERIDLSPGLTEDLRALSRRAGATLFATLMAGLVTLLNRYSGQDDIIVGCPAAGRSRLETRDLVGCFINTLAFRTDASGNPSFRQLLARVRDVARTAYGNADVPFHRVVEALRPTRSASYTPLFQVAFTFQNTPSEPWSLPDVAIHSLPVPTHYSEMDLDFVVTESGDGLTIVAEYSTDLFDAKTVRNMLATYSAILQFVVQHPDESIRTIPLATGSHPGSTGATVGIPECCVHDLVAQQALRTPQRVALTAENGSLTYASLNERASRLAQYLRKCGVGPETLVGVSLDRTTDLLVGLLGILKAGGAYVPLDPTYPHERLSFMLADSEAKFLLTQQSVLVDLPHFDGQVICLEADSQAIEACPTEVPDSGVTPDNLAYVIYTSGSTGVPKGVMIPHRAVVNVLESMARTPGLGSEDVLLAVTTLSFDIAALELFLPLTVGARVALASQATASDGAQLAHQLVSSGATIMQATPSTWRLLLFSGWQGDGRLKMVSGGEPLAPDLAAALRERGGELWNVYGPTETTIWVTAERVEETAQISIGRPIENTCIYVLDEALQPVPTGVPGELFVGGAGLARGYLRRPELTSERFISDPVSSDGSARLYRTGDIGRWRSDGTLELFGRTDDQVKIRGHRIEPGEIESVLRQHPCIRQAAAVVSEKAAGDQRLVAYIVRNPSAETPSTSELLAWLRGHLPEYMVPNSFVALDRLPTTPNGKLDRTVLRALDVPDYQPSVGFEGPRTSTEAALARIWTELLDVQRVGTNENFFDVGGHSLLTVRMFHMIRERLGVELPLAALFPDATIARLGIAIDTARPGSPQQSIIALQPHGGGAPFFCIHGVDGEVVRFAQLARRLGDDQPFYGIRAQGLDEGTQPYTTISDMLAQYVAEIRQASPGPYRVGGFSFGGIMALEVANQLRDLGERVELVAIFDTPCYRARTRIGRELAGLPSDLLAYLKNAVLPENRLKFVLGELRRSGRAAAWLVGARRLPPHVQDLEQLVSDVADVSAPHHKVAQANFRALASFCPRPYAGRVTLFRARVRPLLDSHSPTLGWEQLALGGVDVRHVPGTHASIFDEPYVGGLAQQLRRVL